MPETSKRCINCGRLIPEDELICLQCGSENEMQTFRPRIVTNGDKIRAMSDEELACYIRQCACCEYEHDGEKCVLDNCTDGIVKWLKKEAEP